ncbi:CDP-glycerol glycerophosphotransferase family protein [Streptomyces sp. NPDC087420]|uniref:CDP-glycerol glycerophosphotransferase family protein n=1 Tax=Streptomyces sp. NPDC087420 TaxID=3365785 RepID=UPI00383456D1
MPGHAHRARRPGRPGVPADGHRQGVPQGVHRERGPHLPARPLLRRRLDLPGADDGRVDRDSRPGVRGGAPTPAARAPVGALGRLRPVRPRVRLPHRPPRGVPLASGRARPHARPPRAAGGHRPAARRVLPAGPRPPPPLPHPGHDRRPPPAAPRRPPYVRRPAGGPRPARPRTPYDHRRAPRRARGGPAPPLRPPAPASAARGPRGLRHVRPRRRPGGDPAAIERKVRELAPGLRTSWLTDPDSFAYWTALARSAYLTSNTPFDPRLVKRPGQTLLQTHRGTPLGSVGLDLADRPAVPADLPRLLKDAARWDYTLSANRHATLTHEKAYPSPATTLEYGHPRHDTLHAPADVPGLRESLGIPEGFTTVLYAPAHRDHQRTQTPSLDLERLARSLGPRYVVLTRVAPAAPHPRIMDVSDHPSAEVLCLVSDALITDYAPLMFDYAHLDRPIVLHHADRQVFEAVRGTSVDLRAFPPGAVARTEDELIDIFTTDHWRGSRSTQLRTAFRARFCPYADAGAAERVVRHVFLT